MNYLFAFIFWIAAGSVIYHLAGYPILLALLTRLFKKPVRKAEFTPFVSIIIPAHNEGGVIKEKINSILSGSYPADCLEIIVPEDGSTDDTADQVCSITDPRVMLDHSSTRGGKMAAINRAVQRAKGDFLVFTDANAILLPDTLNNLMSNFADPTIGCVCGRKTVSGNGSLEKSENAYWRYESWIKSQESRLSSTPAAVGELLAMRRSLFQLPSRHIINDDFQIAVNTVRQGFRAIYDHSAVTVEKGTASLSEEFSRKKRIAAGRWQLTTQVFQLSLVQPWFVIAFISHKLLRLLIFPLLLLAFIGNLGALIFPLTAVSAPLAILSLAAPWGILFLSAQILFYLLAGLGYLLDRLDIRVKPLYFLYYFLNAQAAAFSGFFSFSSGRQTVLWRKVAR
jgi:poly-beta-1,6-N-acetyl-D-glucosamine synthase